jgi:glycosyltransferase involved in cell wall biosynthesis
LPLTVRNEAHRMKVILVAPGLPHYFNLVLNRLNRFPGLEMQVIAPADGGQTTGKGVHQTTDGIEFKVHRLPEYRTYYGKVFFENFGEIIEAERPDVLIFNWPYVLSWVFYPSLYRRMRQLGIKLMIKEIPFQVPAFHEAVSFYANQGGFDENMQPIQSKKGLLARLRYRLVAEVRRRFVQMADAHVNYRDDAPAIHASYGVETQRVFVTANSPDTDYILGIKNDILPLEPILPPNPYRLLHVGRLVKWKRVDMLIEVLRRLLDQYPQAELVVVGSGPEEQALKQQVSQLTLQDHVRFVGAVYDMAVLGQYFMASQVYVLAGMGGLSINEAMCFDKPVVCSVADGTERVLVREGYNGRYFEDGNPDSLYGVLDQLFSKPEITQQMGVHSGQIIRNEINIHTVTNRYVDAFEFVMGQSLGRQNLGHS